MSNVQKFSQYAMYLAVLACSSAVSMPAWAKTISGEIEKQPVNVAAIVMFLIFVCATLGITYWASKKTQTADSFYTGGGGISGTKNGIAIAGDYMSAATLLGFTSMVYTSGYDGLIYASAFFVGWPIVLFLIAERLRNLGRYTFADVVSYRFAQKPVRIFAASGTLTVVSLYLIVQMVGAGKLIELLFGLDYVWAVVIVGTLMMVYVFFGGMLATTWVQIIKAVLLLFAGTFISLMVLSQVGFSPEALFRKATEIHKDGTAIMAPGSFVSNPVEAVSMGIGLVFGTAGLPHILMRFFTVPDAKEARKSVFVAATCVGYFFSLTFIMGMGAIMIVTNNPEYFQDGKMIGGLNMAVLHLSHSIGGNMFLGFISAVAFATILAVVAGLTISGASAVSHDLYSTVVKKGTATPAQELKVSRITAFALSTLAIVLGLAFEKQNLAFMVSLVFAVASSVNFPILFLSMFWRGLTTRGAVMGGFAGLFASILLIVLSPSVWVDILGNESAIFPYKNIALFCMPLTFFIAWIGSVTDKSERAELDRGGYDAQYVRSLTGIGAEKASDH